MNRSPEHRVIVFLAEDYINSLNQMAEADSDSVLAAARVFARKTAGIEQLRIISRGSDLNPAIAGVFEAEIEKTEQSESGFILDLFQQQSDIKTVTVFHGIYPLYDSGITGRIASVCDRYSADFAYGENLPPGICPVIYGRELLRHELKTEGTLYRQILDDINRYHIEIHYELPDLRMLRLDFSCADRRSLARTARLLDKVDEYADIEPQLQKDPALLFSFPSYIQIELTGHTDHPFIYGPYSAVEAPAARFSQQHLNKVLQFAREGFDDTSLCFSGPGEPLKHPQFADFVRQVRSEKSIASLVIETDGTELGQYTDLLAEKQPVPLYLMIQVPSFDNWQKMRQSQISSADFKKQLLETIYKLCSLDETFKERIYIEIPKITDNENELESMYDTVQQAGVQFLLQKFNSYIGLLPEKRVSDMTPLERSFCWHLRRDLFIRPDGSVAFCKQDVRSAALRGNLDKDELSEIWSRQKSDWQNDYRGDYPQVPDCAACDEYFTFNL